MFRATLGEIPPPAHRSILKADGEALRLRPMVGRTQSKRLPGKTGARKRKR